MGQRELALPTAQGDGEPRNRRVTIGEAGAKSPADRGGDANTNATTSGRIGLLLIVTLALLLWWVAAPAQLDPLLSLPVLCALRR